MMTNEEHLSMFELDLYFAFEAPDARIERHVAECERCTGYLSQLRALSAGAGPPPPPIRRVGPSSSPRRPRTRALGLTLAAGAAALVTVTALLVSTPEADAPAVAVKGSPAVQLLVRRGDETRPWDGNGRVRTGDALGLRVVCEDFSRVAVATLAPEGGNRWLRLSDGPCPESGGALPLTLVVDDAPGRERFAVVFTKLRLDDAALVGAIDRRQRDHAVWVTHFELDKEVAP
jgi:hypothetical protein